MVNPQGHPRGVQWISTATQAAYPPARNSKAIGIPEKRLVSILQDVSRFLELSSGASQEEFPRLRSAGLLLTIPEGPVVGPVGGSIDVPSNLAAVSAAAPLGRGERAPQSCTGAHQGRVQLLETLRVASFAPIPLSFLSVPRPFCTRFPPVSRSKSRRRGGTGKRAKEQGKKKRERGFAFVVAGKGRESEKGHGIYVHTCNILYTRAYIYVRTRLYIYIRIKKET